MILSDIRLFMSCALEMKVQLFSFQYFKNLKDFEPSCDMGVIRASVL